jgi:6-phosphogluconolactonase (cycloisomerase 2 family)
VLTAVFSEGQGINTYNIATPSAVTLLTSQTFPGNAEARPSPQTQARPHEAVLDPTGDFLVFPDLGADVLHVLHVDKATLATTEAVRIDAYPRQHAA